MTRILSDLLQAPQMQFRLRMSGLEKAGGHQNQDIKLSVDVVQQARQKLRQLGLDSQDTTPEELYQALKQRASDDDKRLEKALRLRAGSHVNAEANLMDGLVHALTAESADSKTFMVKPVAVKRLLKKQPPKKLQKMLKYRSLDGMLRAESPAALVAAALSVESQSWAKIWREKYKQLRPADFETKSPQILSPTDKKWQPITDHIMHDKAHTVLGLPELGAVILLPMPKHKPAGMVLATAALAVHELNAIAAAGNYLKAAQVHGDFAQRVQSVALGRVQLNNALMEQALPWHVVQQYFARTKQSVNEDIFGPYVQAADFYWHDACAVLSKWAPSLAFWENSDYLSFMHQGKIVSLNLLDSAINACNQLEYQARQFSNAQSALWNELALRYLNHENLEQAVADVLQPQKLAVEEAAIA